MSATTDKLIEELRAAGASVTSVDAHLRGFHLQARASMAILERCAAVLRDAGLYPVFMTAVHTDPAFVLYYQFAAADRNVRVMLSAPVETEKRAHSLTPLFPGLQWHEREARDMFGIIFDNHPDLRPLFICDEDRDLHPLRKAAGSLKTPEQLGLTARPDIGGEAP